MITSYLPPGLIKPQRVRTNPNMQCLHAYMHYVNCYIYYNCICQNLSIGNLSIHITNYHPCLYITLQHITTGGAPFYAVSPIKLLGQLLSCESIAAKLVRYPEQTEDHITLVDMHCTLATASYLLLLQSFCGSNSWTINLSLHASSELWQGRRWLSEPHYHANSTTIEDNEVFPHDFVSVLHVEHGVVLGKIAKFFTQVWISCIKVMCNWMLCNPLVYAH